MTRNELEQAAFWHQPVCLSCGEVGEEQSMANEVECESCGQFTCIDARVVLGFIRDHLLGAGEEMNGAG